MARLTGLAVVPALICGGMMLGLGAMAAFGLRRAQDRPLGPTPRTVASGTLGCTSRRSDEQVVAFGRGSGPGCTGR